MVYSIANPVGGWTMRWFAICLVVALTVGGCSRKQDYPAPPKVEAQPSMPRDTSTVAIPLELSLGDIQQALEQRIPRQLWSIDEAHQNCVPGQQVKLFGKRHKVTPDIRCRIVGQVTRGSIALAGSGQRLTVTLPVRADVSARNIGGVIKQESATARAQVRADVRLSVDRNWNPRAKVQLSYDWTDPPGIDFLGQRITFTGKADERLVKVLNDLERELQREIDRASLRPLIASAWKEGFTVFELNRDKPPAWMRVTPKGLGLSSYRVEGRRLILNAEAEAWTETFIAKDRPAKPEVTPLPPQIRSVQSRGLRFFIPVTGDYAQLEPVILRALRKLAAKGIRLEDVGHIEADFQKVTVHATEGGRLAVGIQAKVQPVGEILGTRFSKAQGEVWMTALPVNAANSQVVTVKDLEIYGGADQLAADLLIQLMRSEAVQAEIATGLRQDFQKDFDHVLVAARKAIADRREGDFRIALTIDDVHHEPIQVTGAGLFLPVRVTGKGQIRYDPRPAVPRK